MSDKTTTGGPSERAPVQNDDEIYLSDVISVLWRNKWLILGLPLLTAAALIAYHVSAIRLPPERSPAPDVYTPRALALVHTEIDPFGAPREPATGTRTGGTQQAELAMRLAGTNSFVDVIAEEFDFNRRYGLDDHSAPRHAAREMIRGKLKLSHERSTGLLEIGYTDVDRELATEIANRVTQLLDERMANIGSARERTRMELIEQKLVEVEREVAELEEQIAVFQSQYGVLSVSSLAEEQIRTIAKLRERVIEKEIEIATYAVFTSSADPTMRRLRSERDNLRRLLGEIQSGYEEFQGLMPTQQELPRIALAFERLQRESRVQEQLLTSLTEQYELVRLAQGGTAPLFQVLEAAEVPERRSGPARRTMVIIRTFVAGFLAVLIAFAREYIRNSRRVHGNVEKRQKEETSNA